MKTEICLEDNSINRQDITPGNHAMTDENDILVPNVHDATEVDANNAQPMNGDSESTLDDDTPILDVVERNV